jgi:hypothetical protein
MFLSRSQMVCLIKTRRVGHDMPWYSVAAPLTASADDTIADVTHTSGSQDVPVASFRLDLRHPSMLAGGVETRHG